MEQGRARELQGLYAELKLVNPELKQWMTEKGMDFDTWLEVEPSEEAPSNVVALRKAK